MGQDLVRTTLVAFSDGSTRARRAAAILHNPTASERATNNNIVAQVACETRGHPTPGMLELAGIGLSLALCDNYVTAFARTDDAASICTYYDIFIYCDNLPIVGFAVQGGEADAGAKHLSPLVAEIGAMKSKLSENPFVQIIVATPDAGRRARGIRRADHMAGFQDVSGHGPEVSAWPPTLARALAECRDIFEQSAHEERQVMMRF